MNIPKLVRDLARRKAREERGMVVAEGERLVADVLGSGARVEALLAADDAAEGDARRLLTSAEARDIDVAIVSRKEFVAMADTETPSGILAVVRWAPAAFDPAVMDGLTLVIDGVQDPGNVGTMLRTAFALGAARTIALDGTADTRNPKVLRGAMGAHFRHPVIEASFADLRAKWPADVTPLLAVQDGTPAHTSMRGRSAALVIGSEGRGVRAEWASWPVTPKRLTISMVPGAESLNAAIAAGILLYELNRVA